MNLSYYLLLSIFLPYLVEIWVTVKETLILNEWQNYDSDDDYLNSDFRRGLVALD